MVFYAFMAPLPRYTRFVAPSEREGAELYAEFMVFYAFMAPPPRYARDDSISCYAIVVIPSASRTGGHSIHLVVAPSEREGAELYAEFMLFYAFVASLPRNTRDNNSSARPPRR